MGLNVPKQVTVIGCDNDPLIWSSASPHLTSLQLPFRELGFKAAEMLDKLLRGRKPPLRTIRVGGTHLFERESSAHIPPATALVENAREYIKEHACNGIGAIDVIRHAGASRSLLELRFRQVCGKSILEDILDVRLAEVQRQLKKTNRSILQIGRDCGFNAPNYLKRLFRKRFGASMREYRAAKGPFSAASAS
jgi:LacI family transcriptional regulator